MRQNNLEIVVRAIVVAKDNVLLCRSVKGSYYFFPGGHVEFDEMAEGALRRELKEEIGTEPDSMQFIGAVENIFEEGGRKHHELNLVFEAEAEKDQMHFPEDHIEFEWRPVAEFSKLDIRPHALRNEIIKWLGSGKIFWISQVNA